VGAIIDISLPLSPATPTFPGDPPFEVERISEAQGGESFALSRLTLGSHSGTHVDPPAHYLPGGATVDQLPLDACIGPAVVLDVSAGSGAITPDELDALPDGVQRVLLRTGGRPLDGRALHPDAAARLAARGVRLAGIDTLSIGPVESPGEVHRLLLAAGVVILEGLDLTNAPPGDYTLLCLPLKLAGGDGAPARAVLLQSAGGAI
jgi:arylformamidase